LILQTAFVTQMKNSTYEVFISWEMTANVSGFEKQSCFKGTNELKCSKLYTRKI